MKATVKTAFAGIKYSGIPGDTIEIREKEVYCDLLRAGYIAPAHNETAEEKKPAKKASEKTAKRASKK